jgi:hypothetical protein
MFPAEALIFGVVILGLAALTTSKVVGPSVSYPTELDDDGVVCTRNDAGELEAADPEALARGLGVAPEVEALARVMASEAGELPWIAQLGVAWTVVNHARAVGRSVLAVVVRAALNHGKDDGTGDGYFGRQGNPRGGYRYVASSRDATQDQRDTAKAVLAGDVADPTSGAVNFDSPRSYGAQAGTDASGADTFAENRLAEGKEQVPLPGVSSNAIRFWRPA